jgi:protein tyrosine/serine phosphatase
MRYPTRLLSLAFACAIALSPATPAAARTRTSASPATTSVANIRIENFGRINANYYRGAQPEGRDYADLAALGVKTIVDLQEADGDANEPALVREAGMTYYRIPMSTHRPPTADQLALFFKLVSDPASGPVYVHCKGGRHRTGVMTAAYRMSFDGWSADQAFAEMKRFQFGSDFLHPEFKKFVYDYKVPAAPAAKLPAVLAIQTP